MLSPAGDRQKREIDKTCSNLLFSLYCIGINISVGGGAFS